MFPPLLLVASLGSSVYFVGCWMTAMAGNNYNCWSPHQSRQHKSTIYRLLGNEKKQQIIIHGLNNCGGSDVLGHRHPEKGLSPWI